jgi:long-chain fatty acid transport protein
MCRSRSVLQSLLVLTLALPGFAYAGGAYIYEMGSSTEVGYGGVGMAARAGDAGTVFTNPAGMTRFDESELLAGGLLVYIYAPFKDDGNSVEGTTGGSKDWIPAGSVAYVKPVSDRLTLGLSFQNNFGLMLQWDDDWVGRTSSVNEVLLAPQLQPTAAYKVNDWLSVGAGLGLTAGMMSTKSRVANPFDPDAPEGKLKLRDTTYAVQYNLGIMFEPSKSTRIGVRYLSETELDFKDEPQLTGIPGLPDLDTKGLELDINMPQAITGGIYHQLNDDWALLGSVGWEEWSRFGRVGVELTESGVKKTLDENFDDIWHFGAGAEYQFNPKLKLTAGLAYDTSMMTDANRPVSIPLGAMTRYAFGFQYEKTKDLTLGGGFSWMWEGNLPLKPGGDASGKYQKVSLSFLTFYARWH